MSASKMLPGCSSWQREVNTGSNALSLSFFARLFSFFYMKSVRIEGFVSSKAFVSGR